MALSALLVLAAIGFVGIVQDVISGDPLTRADISITQLVQAARTEPLDRVMILITEFGDGIVVSVTLAALLLSLAISRHWRVAFLVGGAFAVAGVTVPLIKIILHRQRPIEIYSGADFFAFPSGHSTFTTLLFATLALLTASCLGLRGQISVWTAALLGVIAIGISRVYLGAHWPSDVMGGVLYGSLISCLLGLLLQYKANVGRIGLWSGVLASVIFLGFGAIHAQLSAVSDIARYAPTVRLNVLGTANWLASDWPYVAKQRIDLIGETEEHLSMQYVGQTQQLAEALKRHGWQFVKSSGLADFLKLLSPTTELDALPPWPLLHDGRWPVLTLIKSFDKGDRRLVFRLWPSIFVIKAAAGNERLLVGSVTEEAVIHPYGALTAMYDEPAPSSTMCEIVTILGNNPRFAHWTRSRPSGVDVFLLSATWTIGTATLLEQRS